MLSKIAILATVVCVANAWTDFHALNPHHKTTELPDDRIHSSHDVHHTFEGDTFFKAKYDAIHHKKWHFVEMTEFGVDFMKHVDCGASTQELFVQHPTAELQTALSKQKYEWTVMTAHHQYHCGETAIFRGVTGTTYHKDTDTLQIHTVQLRYENVFEHLNVRIETDHFEGKVVEHAVDAEHTLPDPSEDAAVAKAHSMNQQGWFKKAFSKVKKAVSKVVNKAKATVSKAVSWVKKAVKTVANIVTGSYSWDKTYDLKTLSYNNDVAQRFSQWNFNGAVKLAASAYAAPKLVFNLQIASMKLTLAEAYFAAYFKGGVRVAFSSTVAYDNEYKATISTINLQSISFKIVTIPVVISITCPITAGYDIDVDGRLSFNFLLSAYGNVKLGLRYTNTRGFQVINEKTLDRVRDFSPRAFRYEVGLQAEVMATFRAEINFLGFVTSALQITAEAMLQKNDRCLVYMTMSMQPIITAQANLQLTVLGRNLINKEFGPKALVSWKIPVINYCVPAISSTRSSILNGAGGHHMALQDVSGSAGETEPVNSGSVQITKPKDVETNNTGITWYGRADCAHPTDVTLTKKLTFSMQFLPGNYTNSTTNKDSTEIILTLNHNITLSSAEGDYRMTNMQRTYAMNDSVVAGFNGQMRLHVEEDAASQYDAAVNETTDPVVINEHINIKVDSEDATKIWVSASSMFCTTNFIQLVSAEYSDDNTTFTTFSAGNGAPEQSLYEKLKAYAIYVPILCVVILAVVVIVIVVGKKKRQAVHGANWAKSQHDIEPIMGGEPARANAEMGHVQESHDSRVAAL